MKYRTLVLTLAAIAAAGCSDSPTEPEPAAVAGLYAAQGDTGTLTAEVDQQVTDLLADGALVEIRLHADGTTTGALTLPAESGGYTTHDLSGTWALEGDSVLLDHAADTFLRVMRLRYEGGRLTGAASAALNGWRVTVALVRE